MEATIFGIDLAKEKFQICGCESRGKVLWNRKMSPSQASIFFSNHEKGLIFLEACSGSNFWARKLMGMGHKVKIIAAQFVKPFVKTNKSDLADAQAIVTAGMDANMRFVPVKSQDKLDLQMVHRVRERLIRQRTSLVNEARAIFFEHGIIFAKGCNYTQKYLEAIEQDEYVDVFSGLARDLLMDLLTELRDLNNRIEQKENCLKKVALQNADCQRLMEMPGIGVISATAVIASTADPTIFKNGRQFAAWVGLVPAHTGTGGKTKILKLSKRGDGYLRRLLMQGALTSLTRLKKSDGNISWARKLKERSCSRKAAIALANKNARIIWHLLTHKDDTYSPKSIAA